jgi:TRAP-type C4-dicarboxylate transport system substrate-binding protein
MSDNITPIEDGKDIPDLYNALPEDEKEALLNHFRTAAMRRAQQWDEEGAMEDILGRDLDIDMATWAAGFTDATEAVAAALIGVDDLLLAISGS